MRVDSGNFVPSVSPGHARPACKSPHFRQFHSLKVAGLSLACHAHFGFKTNFLKNDAETLILNCARIFVILATSGHSS